MEEYSIVQEAMVLKILDFWKNNLKCSCLNGQKPEAPSSLWIRKIPWSRKWQPTPVFLPGKSYRQRSLVVYSPWGCNELNMTEPLNTHAVGFVEIKDGDVKAN